MHSATPSSCAQWNNANGIQSLPSNWLVVCCCRRRRRRRMLMENNDCQILRHVDHVSHGVTVAVDE